MITTKLATKGLRYGREVYADGVLIGFLTRSSDHFRGREYNKSVMFRPVDGGPVGAMSSGGWMLRPMLAEIERRLRPAIQTEVS